MVAHAEAAYPRECCGAILGTEKDGVRHGQIAWQMRNAFQGAQEDTYELDPAEQLAVEKEARARGLSIIGIFHSHPDCDAYFSKRDLASSCPWYSFVVLSIKKGVFDHANSFLPNFDQTEAPREDLEY